MPSEFLLDYGDSRVIYRCYTTVTPFIFFEREEQVCGHYMKILSQHQKVLFNT